MRIEHEKSAHGGTENNLKREEEPRPRRHCPSPSPYTFFNEVHGENEKTGGRDVEIEEAGVERQVRAVKAEIVCNKAANHRGNGEMPLVADNEFPNMRPCGHMPAASVAKRIFFYRSSNHFTGLACKMVWVRFLAKSFCV